MVHTIKYHFNLGFEVNISDSVFVNKQSENNFETGLIKSKIIEIVLRSPSRSRGIYDFIVNDISHVFTTWRIRSP